MSLIKIKLIIILLLIILLVGCWDRRDIEEKVPVLGLAIDMIKEDNADSKIKLTIQTPIPANMDSGENVVWVISAEGESVAEAVDNLQNKLNQEVFMGHLQVIIFGKELAEEGIDRHLNYFRNLAEVRRLSWIAVAEKKAEEIIKAEPKLESIQAIYLTHMLNNAAMTGRIPELRLGDFFIRLANPGQEPVAIMLRAGKEIINYIGLGVFKGDKLVGELNQPDTLSYQRTLGRGENSNLIITNDPSSEINRLIVEIQEIKSSLRPKLENEKLVMNVNLRVEVKFKEQLNQRNLAKEKVVKEMQKGIEEKLEKEIRKVIIKTQDKYQTDIFGFGEYIRAYYPKYWERIHWQNEYSKLDVKIQVKAYIRQVGMAIFTEK